MKRVAAILLMFLSLLIICPGEIFAQKLNHIAIDPKINKEVLLGVCNREGLKSDVFNSYYVEEYASYEPALAFTQKLKQIKPDWHVVVVLGTWCSDSQREVPRFFRIMDECGFPDSMVTMYGIGREKNAGEVDISSLEISLVPTFIFFRKGKEIGRIVESPIETLEKDMLVLLAHPPKPPLPGSSQE